MLQLLAVFEGTKTDGGDTAWNANVLQRVATGKDGKADGFQTLGKFDVFESGAVEEGSLFQFFHPFWNGDVDEASTFFKCPFVDFCDGGGNGDVFKVTCIE